MKNAVRTFSQFINEEAAMISMKDDEVEAYLKNRVKAYQIYTLRDGIIEFDDDDLEVLDKENDMYLFNKEFSDETETLSTGGDVSVDMDLLFVIKKDENGDIVADYKIFKNH